MIEVYCVRGNGDKEMPEIEDKFLISVSDAVIRGKYEIDKQWYLVHSQTLDIPFKKSNDSTAILDNDLIHVSDGELGISGKRRISKITISGNVSDVRMVVDSLTFEDYI
jgi:hypothetical protein